MPKVWSIIRRGSSASPGFSPVEVLLAATIFGFMVTAVIGAIIYGRSSTASAGERGRANAIAEEGVEAVRNIRDSAFTNLPAAGTPFGLAKSGGTWIPSGTSDVTGIFTRTMLITNIDATRKMVTATVTWPQGSTTATTVATSRLTNWFATIVVPTSWTNAIFRGAYAAAGTNDGLKVATVGNYAYMVRNDGTPDFLVMNITDPAAPFLADSLSLAGIPRNVAVSGNYAYVANSGTATELQIINISDPNNISLTRTFDVPGSAGAWGVYAVGTTVYLTRAASATTGTNEFVVINASNPSAPTITGSYNDNVAMRSVYVSGNFAYIATESNTAELIVVDLSTAPPTLEGFLDLASSDNALTIIGYPSRVLVGQGANLRIIDTSDPASPSQIGTIPATSAGIINDVVVDATNTYAFLGTTATGAEFQVANIGTAAIVRTVDITGTTSALNGVGYNTANDLVVGASASDTQEFITFVKN